MPEVVHFAKQRHDLDEVMAAVRNALLAKQRIADLDVTAADASALTGLPLALCDAALLELCKTWPSRIVVQRGGSVLYRFHSLVKSRRPSALSSLYERLAPRLDKARDIVIALFSVLVVPPLLLAMSANMFALATVAHRWPVVAEVALATVLWPVLLIVFAVGFVSAVLFEVFPLMGLVMLATSVFIPIAPFFTSERPRPWLQILLLSLLMGAISFFLLGRGALLLLRFAYDMFVDLLSGKGVAEIRAMWAQIGGFLLGERLPVRPPNYHARRLIALVRQHAGVLTDADLMAAFGWTQWQATSELSRIIADNGGDIMLDEHGTTVYVFDELLRTARHKHGDDDAAPLDAAAETAPRFFACDPKLVWISILAIDFSLFGLNWHPLTHVWPQNLDELSPIFYEGVGAWPLVPLLAILALRLPFWIVRRIRFARLAARTALIDRVVGSDGTLRIEDLSRATLRQLIELGGETSMESLNSVQERVIRFPWLPAQRALAATQRAMRREGAR